MNNTNKQVRVETQTRNPNLFNIQLERDPKTGEFKVLGHYALRRVMKNQHEGEWVKVAPRDMARALRNNKITSA
jgi:hypothetical protein